MKNAVPGPLSTGHKKIYYGWWVVAVCSLISLYVSATIYFGFTAFIDPLVKEFGWTYAQISFAISLRGLEMSLLAPIVGFLVDRYGARRLCLWGVSTIGVGFIVLSFTRTLWMFYIGIILIAFGGGGCTGVVMNNAVSNWFQRRIGLALGIMNAVMGTCGLLIPVIVLLIDTSGWRAAVSILGVGAWIIGIPLSLVIRDRPKHFCFQTDSSTATPVTLVSNSEDRKAAAMRFSEALRQRAFLFIVLIEVIRMTALMAVMTHIMPYLNVLQIPRSTAGLIVGGLSVFSIPGRLGFGWLADRFDKRWVAAVSCGLMTIGMFLLCYVDRIWIMIIFLICYPVGYGGAMTLRGVMIQSYFGQAAFGRLIGLVMGASAIGGMVGPTLAGYLFDTSGSYTPTWIFLGIMTSFTVALMLSLEPPKESIK